MQHSTTHSSLQTDRKHPWTERGGWEEVTSVQWLGRTWYSSARNANYLNTNCRVGVESRKEIGMRKHEERREHGEGTVGRRALWGCCSDSVAYCLQTPFGDKPRNCTTFSMQLFPVGLTKDQST